MKTSRWTPWDDTSEILPVTVPTYLAYCGLSAALRRFRRTKTPFLAILVVDDPEASDAYDQAATYFLKQFRLARFRHHSVIAITKHRANGPTPDTIRIRRAASEGTTIVIWDKACPLDEEITLFADVLVEMEKPDARRIRAAFKRSGVSISRQDEEMIFSETWARLGFAFPPDRPTIAGLRRMRELASAPAKLAVNYAHPGPGPTLSDLHGFGGAAAWAAELARDLADYAEGTIPWLLICTES